MSDSESARVRIVRAFVEKLDNIDLDGSLSYLTDDFVYEAEPKPIGLGYSDSGFDKAEYKTYCEKIAAHAHNIETSIDSIIEDTDTRVVMKETTKFSYNIPATNTAPAQTLTETSTYTATYTFSGDKISHMKVVSDPAFIKKFSEVN